MNQTDTPTKECSHNLDSRSLNTVLAGLRLLQQALASDEGIDDSILDVITSGNLPLPSLTDIDDLCEQLNKPFTTVRKAP